MHRYKSWARQASDRNVYTLGTGDSNRGESILPTYSEDKKLPTSNEEDAANFDEKRDLHPSASTTSSGGRVRNVNGLGSADYQLDGSESGPPPTTTTRNNIADATTSASPPPAPPPVKSEAAGAGDPPLNPSADDGNDAAATGKRTIFTRMRDGCKRFGIHFKDALFHTWVNVLLVFVPIGIAVDAAGLSPGLIFGANAVAIIPLAGMLAHATEAVASRLGDTWGALLNVSFGNAVELIIFIIALVKDEISIVQAALLGSILANLLLILGMAFLLGGLRYQEQLYNNTVTQMSACLLSLSVVSLLLPTAFHASYKSDSSAAANSQVLKVSRGTSVVLLLVYFLYLLFQLKSHSYLYESTPQEIIDEESHPGVFADIMNSSSSSSDSSSSDDSSDTDASTSVHNAGKKIKRALKNRRRRKSSASTSTTNTSARLSALSSRSAKDYNGSSTEHSASADPSRRGSQGAAALGTPDNGDTDTDEDHIPRIRDFVKQQVPGKDGKASDRRKQKKKHHKKHHKKSRHDADDAAKDNNTAILDDEVESPLQLTDSPAEMQQHQPRVVFAAPPEAGAGARQAASSSSPRSPFNRRPLAGRGGSFRPALPKMLSQNVFVAQPPAQQATPATSRPVPVRAQSSTAALRRTSSLPDRLNIAPQPQQSQQPQQRSVPYRADPLPPFHHQAARQQLSGSGPGSGPVRAGTYSSEVSQPNGSGHGSGHGGGNEAVAPEMSRTAAIVLLLISTALVAVCAEFMVDAIPNMLASSSNVSQAFIGLIILPIVSNAAEHVTAVKVAAKNKMDLAIGVAVGSSIQIALLVTPLVVLLGWILGKDMSLYFNLFDTISLFVTAFVVNFLVLDGRSNYLEGSLLIAAYVIIALGAFFYPKAGQTSELGAGAGG